MSLSVLIWLPLAISVVASALPARVTPKLTAVLSFATLGVAIDFLVRFQTGTAGLQFYGVHNWISALGIHYAVGATGLNIVLALLTTVLFTISLVWSSLREIERPRQYFFWFGLAESAVLGAFFTQDLILFVAFFDLMLIPFYFLVGMWGSGDRVHAAVKMVIYTAVGSFLMLVGAIATGVLAASHYGTHISFLYSTLRALPLPAGSQDWIFLCFAIAFLVKMPLTPLHGWLAEAYKSMPIPAVAVFSGVLAKVAAFGFLAIVLPIFPQASRQLQMLMLIIGVVAVLWATLMAFTTRDARLVIAYSSVAQLGFIVLGIFSLKPAGAQGALLQMVNHGVVTAALFFVLAAVAARAGGSENMDDMGGIAFRAPVLASMFLIVILANLAMPGSANFVGEFMILLGLFTAKLPLAVIASLGTIGAAYYGLRIFIGAMHNRAGAKVGGHDLSLRDATAIVPLAAIIIFLAFYPQFGLRRSQASANAAVAAAHVQRSTATAAVQRSSATRASVRAGVATAVATGQSAPRFVSAESTTTESSR
jgi:NADH-quinone oxidoreductase subunit M